MNRIQAMEVGHLCILIGFRWKTEDGQTESASQTGFWLNLNIRSRKKISSDQELPEHSIEKKPLKSRDLCSFI